MTMNGPQASNSVTAMLNAWAEDEYLNRLLVPGFEAIRDGWTLQAASFRAQHTQAAYNIPYGPSSRQVLDIFWPGAARSGPLAMFIHGGYWQALDKDHFSHLAVGFNAHGIALALPSYDLCPQVSLNDLVVQIRSAAAHLIKNFGRSVYATGHSAGGHLTAMLLATNWPALNLPGTIHGGTAISGLFDLTPLLQTSINNALGLTAQQAARLSPVQAPPPAPKLRAFVGARESDELIRQSRLIAEAWGAQWHIISNANHFTVLDPLADPQSALMRSIADDIANLAESH